MGMEVAYVAVGTETVSVVSVTIVVISPCTVHPFVSEQDDDIIDVSVLPPALIFHYRLLVRAKR